MMHDYIRKKSQQKYQGRRKNGGQKGHAPQIFQVHIEKRTKAEIGNLLVVPPPPPDFCDLPAPLNTMPLFQA